MSGFEVMGQQEEGVDKAWDEYVARLKDFLLAETTHPEINDGVESEIQEGDHPAFEALAAIETGDFELASEYLDREIEKAHQSGIGETDQRVLAALDIRQSDLEKLKEGLERQ